MDLAVDGSLGKFFDAGRCFHGFFDGETAQFLQESDEFVDVDLFLRRLSFGNEEDDFAARFMDAKMGRQCLGGSMAPFLVDFRQFAGDAERSRGIKAMEIVQSGDEPLGTFESDRRASVEEGLPQGRLPLLGFARNESDELKALRVEARTDERLNQTARARDGGEEDLPLDASLDERKTWDRR